MNLEIAESYDHTPPEEKKIRIAVLVMALRDLYDEPHIRRAAIQWFRASPIEDNDPRYTFIEIAELLCLGEGDLNIINDQVMGAEGKRFPSKLQVRGADKSQCKASRIALRSA